MNTGQLVAVQKFLDYIQKTASYTNKLQQLKRRLAQTVHQIEDYIQCFKMIDLDKRGVIYPNILQNFLIHHKFYFQPTTITKFYHKYSHEKKYLTYQDLLESLLPHQDFVLISHTITNPSQYLNKPQKFSYSCKSQRIQSIHYFTAFVISEQMKCLEQDYSTMSKITRSSQRVGAILWRLLDHNHNNQLDYLKLLKTAKQHCKNITQQDWFTFLYWHFHSYKKTITRADFMLMLDVYNQQKRATSACKLQQTHIQSELWKKAEEERVQSLRIQKAVMEKLMMMPHLTKTDFKNIVKEEHFDYGLLNKKRELKGSKGYSNPKNLIKYAIQRF